MDFLYVPNSRDAAPFEGLAYRPPETFEHGEWHPVAAVVSEDGDGQSCIIDEQRLPARFFRLRALPDTNSLGEQIEPFQMTTGSGGDSARVVVAMANALASGMLGMNTEND